jgi:two-component sensor histidine kinase
MNSATSHAVISRFGSPLFAGEPPAGGCDVLAVCADSVYVVFLIGILRAFVASNTWLNAGFREERTESGWFDGRTIGLRRSARAADSVTLRLAPQSVDLAAVVQAAVDAVQPLAVTKNVQLTFSRDSPAIETVSGDAGRLQQVMWNLLANAIKFSADGGRVDVVIERSNDDMEIRVVDSGQGISPDFLPHVFERFRQADDATTQRHTGLGLGLAIVRQLVELHRGTVDVASEGVGRGATFTVRLPIAAGEAHLDHAAALGEQRTAASTVSPMPRVPRLDE